ncbi:MAG: hypothetical protein IPH45_15805 [Bacteroidales bacterium]|nr:hypothetical protein [Bacteroidales bacterium]
MQHILVTNFNENLLKSIRGKALVIRTSDLFSFRNIAHVVNEHNKLHCIQAIVKGNLTEIPVSEDWRDIPINLYVPSFGDIRTFIEKSGLWRNLSVRIFLSSSNPENFTHLQMIASLGIDCGIWFDKGTTDWQSASDLLHYAIYGKVPHGSIEPFVYLVDHYHPTEYTDFSSVYFNNPTRYLHMDSHENLALTAEKLVAGDFIGTLDELDIITEKPGYQSALIAWQDIFMANEACSSCPAWRVCLGKFSATLDENPGCADFLNDVMEAAEFVQSKSGERRVKQLCQL